MAQVEEVVVRYTVQDRLSAPTRQARREVDLLRRSLDALNRSGNTLAAGGAGSLTRQLRDLNSELTRLNGRGSGPGGNGGGLPNTQRNVSTLEMTMRSAVRGGANFVNFLGREVVQASAATVTALTAAGAAAVALGVKTAASLETQRVAIEALAGPQEAPSLFQWIKDKNLQTPFSQTQINDVIRMGLTSGIATTQIRDLTSAVLNFASASGDMDSAVRISRALGQIGSSARISGQDLLQLQNAGVNWAEIIADNTGASVEEVRRLKNEGGLQGLATPQQFVSWIAGGKGEYLGRISGLAEKQRDTLTGVWRNAQDQVNYALADAATPFNEQLKSTIPVLTGEVIGLLHEVGPDIFRAASNLISLAQRAIPALAPVASAFFKGVADVLGADFSNTGLTSLGREMGQSLTRFFDTVADDAPEIARAFTEMARALPKMIDSFTRMEPVLKPVAEALGKVAGTSVGANALGAGLAGSVLFNGANSATGGALSNVATILALRSIMGGKGGGGAGGGGGGAGKGNLGRGLRIGGGALAAAGGALYGTEAIASADDSSRFGWGGLASSTLGYGTTGATLGAGLGLLGGPFAPITSSAGAAIGGGIGAALGGGLYALNYFTGKDDAKKKEAAQAAQVGQQFNAPQVNINLAGATFMGSADDAQKYGENLVRGALAATATRGGN